MYIPIPKQLLLEILPLEVAQFESWIITTFKSVRPKTFPHFSPTDECRPP